MRKPTRRPTARLLPIVTATAEYGITEHGFERLISTGALRLVELPGIRRRLLDRRDIERFIEECKR